jgi:hypothetical protein
MKGEKMMKKLSQSLTLLCVAFLSIAMLVACATTPQEQPKADAAGQTPGLYKNEEYRFTVKYPENFKTLAPRSDIEVLYVTYPNQWNIPNIGVSVSDLSNEALDPQVFMDSLKDSYPGTKRFQVLSQKDLTLKDGIPAKSFTFKWNWTDGTTKLQSAALITNKGDKSFTCTATTVLGGDTKPEVLQSWCDTFTFE